MSTPLTQEAEQFRAERDAALSKLAAIEAWLGADGVSAHALLLRVRDELRVIDRSTCSTFDGHGIRALLRAVEREVGA